MTIITNAPVQPGGPSHIYFRLIIALFALLIGGQCLWLLLTELTRPEINALPIDQAAAVAATKQRNAALWAASAGAVRGDLWTDSAFTYADLIFTADPSVNHAAATVAQARDSIMRAIDEAPTQSSVWLLLAGVASHYPATNLDPIQALKMSFYTGPSEQRIIPLRLRLAIQANQFDDVEIREFVARDLRLLIGEKQGDAIANAYATAPPPAQRFIEQTVNDFDPSMLGALRARDARQKSIPN